MIKSEIVTFNQKQYRKTYSDSGFYIKQVETGIYYSEAIDVLDAGYTYIETNEKIEEIEEIQII